MQSSGATEKVYEWSHHFPSKEIDVNSLTFSKQLRKGRSECAAIDLINKQTNERWNMEEAHQKADLLARGLLALGLKRTDNMSVGGVASNLGASVHIASGLIGLGHSHQHIIAPIEERLQFTLAVIAPRILIIGEGMGGAAYDVLIPLFDPESQEAKSEKFPSIEFVYYDDSYKDRAPKLKFLRKLSDLMELGRSIGDEQFLEAADDVQENDTFTFYFTSGTTGIPKCVIISQQDMAMTCESVFQGEKQGRVVCPSINVDEVFGYSALRVAAIGGATGVVMLPDLKTQSLDDPELPKYFVDIINEEEATTMVMSIRYLELIIKYLKASGQKLPSVKAVLIGAQLTTRDFKEDIMNTIGAIFVNFYGMSEMMPIGTSLPPITPEQTEMSLSGRLIFNPLHEVKLVDGSGEIVKIGEEGEIWVKSPVMTVHYKSQAKSKLISDCGFLMTGDAAIMFPDGSFDLKGRISEAERLKVFGQVVHAGPIEESLMKHEAIEAAAVVGYPSNWRGFEVIYCITFAKEKGKPSEDEIFNLCETEKMVERHWPSRCLYFDELLPLTGNIRKIDRTKLRGVVASMIEKDPRIGLTAWFEKLQKPFLKS